MAYETLVAVYELKSHADAAVAALKAAGFAASDISVFDKARLSGAKTLGDRVAMWRELFGAEVFQHEATIYSDAIQRDGVVIAVRVPPNEVAHARAVLDVHLPVNVHDRAVTSGVAHAARVDSIRAGLNEVALAPDQRVAVSDRLAAERPEVLRLAEEQLEVGKQIVEEGRTRVRRFVTEKEVAQDVTLHDEHAEVIRKAITGPAIRPGDIDWADEEIEVVETAERAIVNKTARVVEEIGLQKVGTEHVETIREKLRRQQVEIEEIGPDGKPRTTRPAT